jgi:hypothetical protein
MAIQPNFLMVHQCYIDLSMMESILYCFSYFTHVATRIFVVKLDMHYLYDCSFRSRFLFRCHVACSKIVLLLPS